MGLGKKKGNGDDDDDLPEGLKRKPGESGDELAKRLARQRQGNQICGTCNGAKVVQKEKATEVRGRVRTVTTTEPCKTCGGTGWKSGRVR